MTNITRTFTLGRMNKMLDERLVPDGEYIHAENVRINSSNGSDAGTVENAKGNRKVTTLKYKNVTLSSATTIGAFADDANETIYWFVTGSVGFPFDPPIKTDMIVSYNANTQALVYHVVTHDVLNFGAYRLITSVNKIGDFLFFTDNYNPPRKINVTRSYPQPNTLEQDQITEDDISVIVKPPFRSPQVTLTNTPGDEDFLETRMIAFAYRYKYLDGEYSALSQFSDVAFQPKPFAIDTSLYLNGGMVNEYNTAQVTFNTGPSRVVGIDLCFKYSDDNTIRVIDKYIKFEEGWADNVNKTISFTNKKIYTILPESEVLRLYDNVPRLAQAQTIMGNRLMYGNYLEGYDLVTSTGSPIRTNFGVEVVNTELGYQYGEASPELVVNTFDPADPDGDLCQLALTFDLTGIELDSGTAFGFTASFTHDFWAGDDAGSLTANDGIQPFEVSFIFYINTNYDNAIQMANSTVFKEKIGTSQYVQPVDTCSEGVTFADSFNCSIVAPPGYELVDSGHDFATQLKGIKVIATNTGGANTEHTFTVVFPALQFASTSDPTQDQIFEFLKITHGDWFIQTQGDTRSLHSNRDYEVGIVYLDDYKRATTALVSNDNTVYIPASASDTVNRLRVTIPTDMTVPEWATNYKFVLKPTQYDYDTVYTSFYYPDPNESVVWMKLDGDNQRKVETGDELIVKADANGALNAKRIVSVLDKRSFERDEIVDGSLPGVYMRIKPTGVTIDNDNAIELGCDAQSDTTTTHNQGSPKIAYPVFEPAANNTYEPWAIPAGSQVKIYIRAERDDRGGCGGNCGALYFLLDVDRVASQDYATLKDFWEAEGINLDEAITDIECADADNPVDTSYNAALYQFNSSLGEAALDNTSTSYGTLTVQFAEDTSNNKLYLLVQSGMVPCSGLFDPDCRLKVEVCVRQAMNPVVFETMPSDAQPDIFFESSDVYRCSESGHEGNVQNQTVGTTPGIVDLDFFNCYCFGNGVESYKVKDAMQGHSLSLGERVTSTSAQDYKETRRFADITYSGIFNDESNVNKLNEFNLGLANFKALEDIYGPIQVLDGRKTDVLVLQEDRVSYVLSGKNLLSDAAAGGALTSVPEVLGTQIARIEEYGISYQPESFAKYGYDKFFTDTKRGVVLNLRGSSYSDEQLSVISDAGMRPYFRSEFISGLKTQKLGAYDPYHDEYVLNLNSKTKPTEQSCFPCGGTFRVYYSGSGERIDYCFGTGGLVGEISVEIVNDTAIDIPDLSATLSHGSNSSDTVVIPEGGSATLTVTASDPTVEEYTLSVSALQGGYFDVNASCPESEKLNVVFVTITSDTIAGQTIHNEMYWFTDGYTSPTYNDSVEFLDGDYPFVISKWQFTQGVQGFGTFPQDGSTVRLVSNRTSSDSFEFDYNFHRLYAVRSNSIYSESIQNAETLLNNAELLTPINISGADTTYYGDYEMPVGGDHLYLIYDYRDIHEHQLCFGERALDACCGCLPHVEYVPFRGSEAVGYGSLSTACSLATDTIEYVHDGTQEMPEVGDYLYTSNTVGEDTTYTPVEFSLIKVDGLDMLFKTGSSGVVLTRTACDVYEADFYTGAATAEEAENTTGTFTVYSPQDIGSVVSLGRYLFTNNVLQTNLPPAFYKHVATGIVVEVGPYGKIISVQ